MRLPLIITTLLVALVGSSACTSMLTGANGESAGQPIGADTRDAPTIARDDQISRTIRNSYAGYQDLARAGLDVETRRGVVTLRGTLNDFDQRDRAARIANDVPGVMRVVNQITVRR